MLKFREEIWFEDNAHPEHRMEFIIVEQTFPISVIVLSEKIQVHFLVHSPGCLKDSIVIQIPSFSLDHGESEREILVVGSRSDTPLENTTII